MEAAFVRIGDHVLNLEQIGGAHWEGTKLYVHFAGGRWSIFEGDEADRLWKMLEQLAESRRAEVMRRAV